MLRRGLRWAKRIVLGLISVVLLAVGAAVIVVHTDWGRELIRSRAEATLREKFPGGARIGKITGSVFGTLVVEDIVIDGADGKPWIAASSAKVKLSVLPLLHKTARIDWIELDDLVVDQHPQPPPKPVPAIPEGAPWTVELPQVIVHRGRLLIASATRTVDVKHVDAYGSLSVDDGAVTITAELNGSWLNKVVVASATLRIVPGQVALPYAYAEIDQARVVALGIRITDELDGVIRAELPAETARLLAAVKLPGDATAVVLAHGGSIDAKVAMAGATVRVLADANLEARTMRGFVIADVPDGAKLDKRFAGSGIVTGSLDAGLDHVRGVVTLDGIRPVDRETVGQAAIHGRTLVAVDATLTKAWVYMQGGFDLGTAHLTGIAEATRDKDTGAIAITKSTLVATARSVGARKADVSIHYIAANARATGPVWPTPQLHVVGTSGGEGLRYTTYAADTVDVRFDITKRASGHLDVTGVRKGARLLGAVSLDAHGELTHGEAGDGVAIDVDSHTITTPANGTWSGTGGRVEVDPLHVTVTKFHTGNGDGTVTADVKLDRETKDLTATVDAKQVALATVAPDVKGTVGGKLAMARKAGRWSGSGHLVGTQIAIPKRPAVDVVADLTVANRRVTVAATTTAEAGVVIVQASVDGPYDLTDGNAWLRLDRRALHDASIEIAHLDASKLGVAKATGTIEGKLELGATTASGTLHARDIYTSYGSVAGTLSLQPDGAMIAANAGATLDGIGGGTVVAALALPDHIFDPAAWQALGKRVLHHATVDVPPIVLDADKLVKLRVQPIYKGSVAAHAEIEEGARTAVATVDGAGLQGGAIKRPLEVHVDAGVDANAHATITAKSGAITFAVIDAHVPFDLDHAADVITAKLDGTVTIPKVSAPELIAIAGRADATGGQVDGAFTIGGTVSRPTVDGEITAVGITLPASVSGRAPARLEKLVATGRWDGATGDVDVLANEKDGGTLHATAHGRPDQLAAMTASVDAKKFDVAPITAFASGAVGAARGVLTADLKLVGFDPNTGDLSGSLQLHDGRVPLSALFGTARSIEADVKIDSHRVDLKLDAKIGKGAVHGTGYVVLAGSTPEKAHADLTFKQVSLVRAFQPAIDANVVADLHGTTQWTGTVMVTNGHVAINSTGGAKLLDAGAPGDIVFIDAAPDPIKPLLQRPPPSKPWLIADVVIAPTTIDVIQDEFQVRGDAHGKLTVSLGQSSIGIDGTIDADRGDIDLLGSHSLLDHAEVIFDGTIDPLLDVRVIRDLSTLTVTADITGRASNWRLDMSSDSGNYTQGELYSFFLGGQPTGSRGEAGQAAVAAGAGYASALFTKKLNKLLPLNLSFNYDPESAESSQAIRIGKWYGRKLFVAFRGHPEARIDENQSEGTFEYHLPNNWLLQGTLGDRNYDAMDIVHRWHW